MANCEIGVSDDQDFKKFNVKIENGGEINVKRRKKTGELEIRDETGKILDQVEIKISVDVISGNLGVKFPPDEFVMYSHSSPGCGYYYIGGRLVYK